MRGVITALLLSALTVSAWAAPVAVPGMRLSQPSDRAEISGVVAAQLVAIRTEDWDNAYAYTASTFRHVTSQTAFVTLITRNFEVICRNTKADFGAPSDNGQTAIMPVRVFADGKSVSYTWTLARENGRWKITGVVAQRTNRAS